MLKSLRLSSSRTLQRVVPPGSGPCARCPTPARIRSKEEAIAYLERNGWAWEVQEPHAVAPLGSSVIKGVGTAGKKAR